MHKNACQSKDRPLIRYADEDWNVVLPCRGKSKRRRLTNTEITEQHSWAPIDDGSEPDKEQSLLNGMQKCIEKFEHSKFYCTFVEQIQTPKVLDSIYRALGSESKMQMVIYGIGNIKSCQSSRFQLSLAILLKRKFDWIGKIEVFDPIITTTESRVMRALNCDVLLVNEQARRQASKPTLFFMPHCESVLYDNLFWANWRAENLNQMILIGNSFDAYQQNSAEYISETAKHLSAAQRFATEVKIDIVSSRFANAFYKSSWHFFNVDPEADMGL